MIDNSRRAYSVNPISSEEIEGAFDAVFYAIGFEARSAFIARRFLSRSSSIYGIDLYSPGLLSYDENLAWAKSNNVKVVAKGDLSLGRANPFCMNADGNGRLLIDVSSMDRRTLSLLIFQVLRGCVSSRTQVYFLYAPSFFTPPAAKLIPAEFSGPVNDVLGGEAKDPRSPTVLFLGLGYELGLALGVVETFEPARVLAYAPRGVDKRFDRQVDRANLPLFSDGRYVDRIEYSLRSPANAMIDLKDRFLSMREHARIVFVPLGPKLFASMAILCGYIYWPDICVWRISSRLDEKSAQREADGTVAGFRLQIDSW